MATPFPTPATGDVWGEMLLEAIDTRDEDTLAAAQDYADGLVLSAEVPVIVLGPQDPVPAGAPSPSVIYRYA